MASKFEEFIRERKIDSRRLMIVSNTLERLRPEDRAVRLKKGKSSAESAENEGDGEKAAPAKPRSGRPVTRQLLDRAVAGKPISGPAKHRLLRAVNRTLEQKKQDPVDLRALF